MPTFLLDTPTHQSNPGDTDVDNTTPPFPTVIDSTMRADFAACPTKFYWGRLLHLHSPRPNVHQHFGAVFARALEVTRLSFHRDGATTMDAIAKGAIAAIRQWGDFPSPTNPTRTEANKTLSALLDCHLSYFMQWPLDRDPLQPYWLEGQPVIEMSFALPFGINHPLTGEPLLYAGRFDMLVQHGKAVWVLDEKTSGSLGDAWAKNWRLRAQLTGYTWACRQYGIHVNGAFIRGIAPLQSNVVFQEAMESRPGWQVAEWLGQLQRDVTRMRGHWLAMTANGILSSAGREAYTPPHTHWDKNLDASCSAYGGCPYLPLCDSQDPTLSTHEYTVRKWDPLHRSVDP